MARRRERPPLGHSDLAAVAALPSNGAATHGTRSTYASGGCCHVRPHTRHMLTSACARRLAALGHGTYDEAGADLFLEDLPAHPENAAGVYAQPGRKVGRFRRPGVQIIVRADGTGGRARGGFERAQAILEALDGDARVVWGEGTDDAVRVAWCEALQAAPVSLGDDDNGRPRWSVRFDVELAGEVV